MGAGNIAVIVSLVSLAGTLAKVVYDYARLKSDMQNLRESFDREQQEIKVDVKELFGSRNSTNTTLTKLDANLNNLVNKVEKLTDKIDGLCKFREKNHGE